MMINVEKVQMLSAILNSDESLISELAASESAAEACEVFALRGLEISEEELISLFAQARVSVDGELDEDNLECVAGGVGPVEVLVAMGTIYGAYEACKWAWNTGKKIGNWICDRWL